MGQFEYDYGDEPRQPNPKCRPSQRRNFGNYNRVLLERAKLPPPKSRKRQVHFDPCLVSLMDASHFAQLPLFLRVF